jgi:hypothetical protein
MERRRTVHIVIHRLWIRTVAAALLSTGEIAAGLSSSQSSCTLWAPELSGFLASLSGRRPGVGTALAEANSFLRIRQPFGDIAWGQLSGNAGAVTTVTHELFQMAADVGLT